MNLRLPSLVLLVLLAAPACTERTRSSDFAVLAQKAYPDGVAGNRDAVEDLWISLFRLPQWYFLANPATNQPAVQQFANEGWLLVFTDPERLRRYAASKIAPTDAGLPLFGVGTAGASDAGFVAPMVAMSPEAARKFLAAYSTPGTVGVRFNEGASSGWFAPLKAVGDIHGMLYSSGKLDPAK